MKKMKIEIWSDIACPYCYIGKRRMEQALSQFPNAGEIEIVWHSYELNPDLPKTPFKKSFFQYMAEQHGETEEQAKAGMKNIIDLAASVGLDYNFDKLVVSNTSDALRLVKLAKESGKADEAEEILFKSYFSDGIDVSDKSVLIRLGVGIGLDENAILEILNSDKYLDEINADISYSEDVLDLQYIPFYLFNNKDIIQGSLTDKEYLDILTKSYDNWKENGVANDKGDRISGKACSIDGTCSI